MNSFKPNSNEEMGSDEMKTVKALNELIIYAMSSTLSPVIKDEIWKQADIVSAYIFKANK